jgi:hypothetical protein
MGCIRHHAIIVSSALDLREGRPWIEVAHDVAVQIFEGSDGLLRETPRQVTPATAEVTNGYRSFAVLSDGSKEDGDKSDEGDAARGAFIDWLESMVYEDGSSPFSWAKVQYGDDEGISCVVRHSDEPNGTECRPYEDETR